MNICHIWQNFFPIESGGVERYLIGLSDFLTQKDNTHFLLITDKAAYVPLSRSLRLPKNQRINSLQVYRLGPNVSSILAGAYFKTLKRQSKLLKSLLAKSLYREATSIPGIDKTDVFHVHGIWQPLYPTIGLLLSKRLNRPFVVTLHGDSTNINDPYAMPIKSPSTIALLRQASAITTFSRETYGLLQKQGLGRTCHLIPNFINVNSFAAPNLSKKKRGAKIVMVSRLSKPKDPITPIKAFAYVKKEIPDATFTIVGYGPLYDYMRRLIHSLNLDQAVSLVGAQSDVRRFLWDSDIYLGTRGSYITTLEAWAAGLVVMAPDFGIMKELVSNGKDGLLTPQRDVRRLATEIVRVLKNKDLRENLIANGLKSAQEHDTGTICPRIGAFYTSLKEQSN
jgi:glycosyltransferase involved in cell wall biosynthesis